MLKLTEADYLFEHCKVYEKPKIGHDNAAGIATRTFLSGTRLQRGLDGHFGGNSDSYELDSKYDEYIDECCQRFGWHSTCRAAIRMSIRLQYGEEPHPKLEVSSRKRMRPIYWFWKKRKS